MIEKIDVVKDDNVNIFKNDIDMYVSLWCEENYIENISDICNITQNRFNALLFYIYYNYFRNMDLKQDKVDTFYPFKHTSYGGYDINKIYDICVWYINFCDRFDKIPNINGFCTVSGLGLDTLYSWNNGNYREATPKCKEIFKKLNAERERGLSDRLMSGKVNPVGVLGCLNHWHGWSGVGNMQEDKTKQAATLDDIRKNTALLSDNSDTSGVQIAENSSLKLSDNLTQLESQ